MFLVEREIDFPRSNERGSLISFFEQYAQDYLKATEFPVRFVVTKTSGNKYHCELGVYQVRLIPE